MFLLKVRRAQVEVITTVLLILVSIAAVVILSNFVINLVKENIKKSDCFQVIDQFEIDTYNDYTFFNSTDKFLYVDIKRGSKDTNLSGIIVAFSDDANSNSVEIKSKFSYNDIFYYTSANSWTNSSLKLPDIGGVTAYKINLTSFNIVANRVIVSPILIDGRVCDKADDKSILVRP
jgi:hypothetical protein